jgi:hypothetical protein
MPIVYDLVNNIILATEDYTEPIKHKVFIVIKITNIADLLNWADLGKTGQETNIYS